MRTAEKQAVIDANMEAFRAMQRAYTAMRNAAVVVFYPGSRSESERIAARAEHEECVRAYDDAARAYSAAGIACDRVMRRAS